MAAAGTVTARKAAWLERDAAPAPARASVLAVRFAVACALIGIWEAVSASGLFFGDIVPSIVKILPAMLQLLSQAAFWTNLQATAWETVAALSIGAAAGITCGIVLGANEFLRRAYEPFLYYFSPTPRIILFPIMIMWFGIGIESKIALGALASFFPIALSTAAGMRGIDRVLIRVGRSFRATGWQMAMKIYLPAMRVPVLTGVRLGFGGGLITVLLAETKLSNKGLGYLVMQYYQRFDMATLYGLLIVLFLLAGFSNALIGRWERAGR
jgi:NitT/TauT family transport system permease protein